MVDDLTISLKSDITSTQIGYFPPSWSSKPKKKYSIDVWKEGTIVKNISLDDKEYYVIGRNNEVCDITLAHPTVSRVHCVLQHRDNGYLFIYDLKTAYGTYVNKNKIETQTYIKLNPGETFKMANSTKMFIVNCSEEEDEIENNTQQSSENISDTLRLLQQSTKINNIQFYNESNWGIKENDEEIIEHQLNEENNDDLNINKLLQKDNLTAKQKSLLDKITLLLNERDHIVKEKENMNHTEYEDNDLQNNKIERKKYYYTKRLGEIKESLDSLKLKLSDSLKATEENSLRFNKQLYKEINDYDDEYYDRTKKINTKEQKTEVINYESMKAALESLIKEKQKYTDLLSQTIIKSNKKENQIEMDSIDLYFIDNEIETKTENMKDKLESIENEIKKTKKILDYVTPIHLKIKRNAEINNAKHIPKSDYITSQSIITNNKQSKKKKESITDVINKMNKIHSSNIFPSNNSEGNEGMVNNIEEEVNNEIELDDEMIDKLNKYKKSLSQSEDKDKKKKQEKLLIKNKEANLFKEIVANIEKSNFEVVNYPKITSRYETMRSNKEKDDKSQKYSNINEDEDLFSGKKRQRDEMKPENDPSKKEREISERMKGKWIEETISDNPFNKYINDNDNLS